MAHNNDNAVGKYDQNLNDVPISLLSDSEGRGAQVPDGYGKVAHNGDDARRLDALDHQPTEPVRHDVAVALSQPVALVVIRVPDYEAQEQVQVHEDGVKGEHGCGQFPVAPEDARRHDEDYDGDEVEDIAEGGVDEQVCIVPVLRFGIRVYESCNGHGLEEKGGSNCV